MFVLDSGFGTRLLHSHSRRCENMMIGGAAVREHHQEFLDGPRWSTGLGSKPIPEKLKHDAIVEALFEGLFSMSTIPEVFFGRIAEYETWKNFKQTQLPFYQIPAVMRQADP